MLRVDYLIVGLGVAGSCLAAKLLNEGRSFVVVDEQKESASSVAVGIYNPVVLKRFSLIWNAQKQLDQMHSYFQNFEKLLGKRYIYEILTRRIIKDQNEIHAWTKKSNQSGINEFLSSEIKPFSHPDFHVPLGYGEVKHTGRIDLGSCIKDFRDYLSENGLYLNERFGYNELDISEKQFKYKDIQAKRIIFCEGFGVRNNPFFSYLPVIGVKGEVLKIQTQTEIPKAIWKAHNFLMPVEGNICFTASTYDRDDLTPMPTEKGKEEMLAHLKSFYTGEFKILEHYAGIRPTIIDRRPVVGRHPVYDNIYILNGMGTRGTLLAPAMTEELFQLMEHERSIDKEADVSRFTAKYFKNG